MCDIYIDVKGGSSRVSQYTQSKPEKGERDADNAFTVLSLWRAYTFTECARVTLLFHTIFIKYVYTTVRCWLRFLSYDLINFIETNGNKSTTRPSEAGLPHTTSNAGHYRRVVYHASLHATMVLYNYYHPCPLFASCRVQTKSCFANNQRPLLPSYYRYSEVRM